MRAETMRLLSEKGLSLDDIIEVAASEERRSDPTAAERKRRQRERERHGVTVTRDTVPPIEELLTPSAEDSPDEAIASSPSRQPVGEAVRIWNEVAAEMGWRTIAKVSAARSKALSSRLREHGLDGWRAAIARARASPYLGGADPPGWFTFDFLSKSGNFLKVIEGNYDRRHSDCSDPAGRELDRLIAGNVSFSG